MDWKVLYQEGFVAGPAEDAKAFFSRVKEVRTLLQDPESLGKGPLEQVTPSLYAFRSNRHLPFWTAAVTWIFPLPSGASLPLLQLPKKRRLFCFANEKEILAHESIHALRAAFNEPKFEEILAYRTSSSAFRRLFGPLFTSTKESGLFLLLCLGAIACGNPLLIFLPLLPWLLRLFLRQRQFFRARHHLPDALLQLLTDREIIQASKGDFSFFQKMNPRMQQIHAIFEKRLTDQGKERYLEKNRQQPVSHGK